MYSARMRCPTTKKWVFDTKKQAEESQLKMAIKDKITEIPNTKFRAYVCPHCEWWHLGHSKK